MSVNYRRDRGLLFVGENNQQKGTQDLNDSTQDRQIDRGLVFTSKNPCKNGYLKATCDLFERTYFPSTNIKIY
jgi:hypothetical protein